MTITNTTSKIRYTGNAVTVNFSFPFRIFNASDLEVYLVLNSTDVATLKTLTTDYSVAITSGSDGGIVTFVSAPSGSYDILIRRVLDRTQGVDIPPVSAFPEQAVENALDRVTMIVIEQDEILDRCIKLSDTANDSGIDTTLPAADPGKVIGWNDAGTALENTSKNVTATQYNGTISAGADASKSASPTARDIYLATDTGKLYFCFTGGIWSTGLTFSDLITFSGAALNLAKGADVASATTCDIGAATGNLIHITGTVTITGLGTVQAGTQRIVVFDGALILTHNVTSLILPSGANITTATGDTALFVSEGSGNWRCSFYQRASGLLIGANPTFEATMSGNQSLNTATNTKIAFDTETFDTNNNYDPTTNYRFTPTVAGKYLVTGSIKFDLATDVKAIEINIYKNGSAMTPARSTTGSTSGTNLQSVLVSTIVSMNGSTDYVEIFGYHEQGGAKNVFQNGSFFSAVKVD